MCGICGAIGIKEKETAEPIVRRMMAAIVHRGPDEEGFFAAPLVAAGVRRLSIIDLPGGSQPVWNEAGTLAIVYNGEIYNFRELREELAARGHRFRTRSDTEVILSAYEAWGEGCLERLRGMFAFAVMEIPRGRGSQPTSVFLARDRFGIKPLYYAVADGAFYFASEVRALIASGSVPARLSNATIPAYLLFGSVCEPSTLVDGVMSLPPGHSMRISVERRVGTPALKQFWDVARNGEGASQDDSQRPAAAASHVRSLLEDAVRTHLVADVPLGVFLSSGLDSTAIAALASQVQGGIHTFTVAFPENEFSEADQARRTAQRLGAEHRELRLSDQEMLAKLDDAIAAFDQPSMDGINTYFVSWAARQAGLKVALSGLGSDELFGGYRSFHATSQVARLAAAARIFPQPLRRFLTGPLQHASAIGSSPDVIRKASAAWLDPTALPHPYFFTRMLFTPQTVASGVRQSAEAWTATPWWRWLSESADQARSMDGFTAVSWLELRSYLANTLLRDTDAMSMSQSLEVRVPFLDTPLVEYVLSLPESEKRGRVRPKSLLVKALGDLLPAELIAQPKRTFTFPWENWLRGPLGQRVAAGLADWSPALQGRLDASLARGVWNDFLKGRTTWSRPWSLYVLNEWAKQNLSAREAEGGEHSTRAAVSAA